MTSLRKMPFCKVTRFLFVILALLALLLPTTIFAESSADAADQSTLVLSKQEREWLRQNPEIKFGLLQDQPPIAIWEPDGSVSGIIPDLFSHLSNAIGQKIGFVPTTRESMHDTARQAGVYGTAAVLKSPRHRDEYLLSAPYLQTPFYIYTNQEKLSKIRAPVDLRGKRVVIPKGHRALADYLDAIGGAEVLEVNTPLEQMHKVTSGEADALMGYMTYPYLINKYLMTDLGLAFIAKSDMEVHVGVNPGNPILHDILNKAIATLSEQTRQEALAKWFHISRDESPKIKLTKDEKAWLEENPVIHLGNSVDWPPIGFVNEQGIYLGIAADYMKAIEGLLGIRVEPSSLDSWKATVEAARVGKLDMLGSVVATPQRKKYLNFTKPYLSYPLVIITRKDVDFIADMSALNGQRVAVNAGSATHDILKNNHPEFDFYPVKNTKHGLMAVERGEASAYISDLVTSSRVMAQEGITGLKISGEAPYRYDISIGINKDKLILASLLQKALDAIPEEKHNEIYRKWMSVTFEHQVDYTRITNLLILLVFLFLLILFWNRHRQVKKLEQEVESRKRAENAIKKSERNLNDAQRIAHLGSWEWDISNNSATWSDELCRIYGVEPGEVEPSFEYFLGLLDKDAIKKINEGVDKALAGEGEYNVEFSINSGTEKEQILSAQGIVERKPDGTPVRMVGTTHDITERKKAEEALRESEHNLVTGQGIAKMGYWKLDPNTEKIEGSDELLRIFGLIGDEMTLNAFAGVVHPEDLEFDLEHIRKGIEEGVPWDIEHRLLLKDGTVKWVHAVGEPKLDKKGKTQYVIGIVQDITEHKHAEEALAKAYDEMELRVKERTSELLEAKEEAEHANQTKSTFLSNMSHELRTPLNAILGFSQLLLRDETIHSKQQHQIKIIKRSGENLLEHISDILDVARIETNKIELTPTRSNIITFVDYICSYFKASSEEKGIEVICEASSNTPSIVDFDEKRLQQILLNLVGNAVKFTDHGKVVLRVEPCELASSESDNQCCLRFKVQDTGVGISPESYEQIFEPFVQLKRPNQVTEGTGLGLSIAQQLVGLMGGELKVESELGVGSCFWFDLMLPVSEELKITGVKPEHIPVGYQGKERTILVVDDIADNREVLHDLLQSMRFKVLLAQSGDEAIVLTRESQPDLILMDLLMPAMDGYLALSILREVLGTIDIPVVAVSASISEEEHALSAGFDAFIPKPTPSEVLVDVLGNLLQLEWIESVDETINEDALVYPSGEELEPLREWIQLGKMRQIIKWAEELMSREPEYTGFAQRVIVLAKNVDEEGLRALIGKN